MIINDGLCFDDVLLVPKYSKIPSRSLVKTTVKLPKLDTVLKHPIIVSNMKSLIGFDMAKTIYLSGGLCIVHRFMPLEDQINIVKSLEEEFGSNVWNHIGFSVGVKKEDIEIIDTLVSFGARILCIDVAHGHSAMCIEMCEWISKTYPNILLIAGNTATDIGSYELWKAGADIVKNGIGGGSICLTRIETGNGVPQFTSIVEADKGRRRLLDEGVTRDLLLISDGGAKSAGDCVKGLCFANLMMIGNIFAGCEETPGEIKSINGKRFKEYAGSSTHKTSHIEGVVSIVPAKESFNLILTKIIDGIKSGCSYQGVDNLNDLKSNPQFLRMTGAGLRESHAHDVIV
jgi:IMP dehydrogenase